MKVQTQRPDSRAPRFVHPCSEPSPFQGCKTLAKALKSDTVMTLLNLSENIMINDESCNSVMDLLQSNTVLAELSFIGTSVTRDGFARVMSVLSRDATAFKNGLVVKR